MVLAASVVKNTSRSLLPLAVPACSPCGTTTVWSYSSPMGRGVESQNVRSARALLAGWYCSPSSSRNLT